MHVKHPLPDCTFVIPFFKDSDDRLENLECILNFLVDNFDTNIILVEATNGIYHFPLLKSYDKLNHSVEYIFHKQEGAIFHRTRVINTGIKASKTPYIAIYDVDVVFPIQNIVRAVELLREGAQMTYPYAGDFVDVERADYLKNGYIRERESFAVDSKGGAVFMNTDDYVAAGMENIKIVGWGFDDCERWHRLYTLGYRIARTEGKCWHIMHERVAQNPHNETNMAEFEKVKGMNKEELRQYITGWTWTK